MLQVQKGTFKIFAPHLHILTAVATLYAKEKGDSQNFDDKAGNYLVHDYPAKVALTAIVEEVELLPPLHRKLLRFFQNLSFNFMRSRGH